MDSGLESAGQIDSQILSFRDPKNLERRRLMNMPKASLFP